MPEESIQNPSDAPIESSADDRLRRWPAAQNLARTVRSLNSSKGLVIGILAPWGNGKTSFVNLMKEEFATNPALLVVDFNPWLFSGTQQLTEHFFAELTTAMRLRGSGKLNSIASDLDLYADILSPLTAIPLVGQGLRNLLSVMRGVNKLHARRGNVSARRDQIAKALSDLSQPIVIVIDDIDRLSTVEIRDVFRLVRLTANFPNMIYLLAFDRHRVESALNDEPFAGRAYLEKIVQLTFDVPAVAPAVLRSAVFDALNQELSDIPDLRFDTSRWQDVYAEVIEPLLTNLRDVARLTVSSKAVLGALGSRVEVVDVLALEAIRVLRPSLFSKLNELRFVLTHVPSSYSNGNDRHKAAITAFVQDTGDEPVARALISHLFPAASRYIENNHYGSDWLNRWRRDHVVAHIDYLTLYLDRVAPAGLDAFLIAEQLIVALPDPDLSIQLLDATPPGMLEDMIGALEVWEGEYSEAGIVLVTTELLNRILQIPEKRDPGMFGFGPKGLAVTRVVLRMFRQVREESTREVYARSVLAGIHHLSSREEFVGMLGHQENRGHKLVSEGFAATLEEELADRIISAPPEDPAAEWALLRVYWFAQERRAAFTVPTSWLSDDLIRALFTSSRSPVRSQSLASRHVRLEWRLAWDSLIQILGSEDAVRSAVEALQAADGETDLLLLAKKYASGWRPKDLLRGDDDDIQGE